MFNRFRMLIVGGVFLAFSLLAGCGTPTPVATPTPVSLTDPKEALAALRSYQVRAAIDVHPRPETGLDKAHMEVEVDAVNAPQRARRTTIRGLRSMAKPSERRKTADVLKLIQVNGDLYISTGTTWLKTPAQNDPEQGFLDPSKLVPDPSLLHLKETDVVVNQVHTDHYTFSDPKALAYMGPEEQDAVTQVQGDVWVARDGGYIVRYRAHVEGQGFRFDFSPQPFAGSVDVTYDVYGANEPLQIERPNMALGEQPQDKEEKPLVLDGFDNKPFPLPEDAKVVLGTHQVAIFDTRLTPEEVAHFYAQALEEYGWTPVEDGANASGGQQKLWQKGTYQLRLHIIPGKKPDEPTHVTVGVSRK
ncbi:MAG: hypothetical protein GXO55_05315 [Chloroflexi bacterium]|nr:hypothetical protein [Chloroflexota bacterium]